MKERRRKKEKKNEKQRRKKLPATFPRNPFFDSNEK